MHISRLEKKWTWIIGAVLFVVFGIMLFTATQYGLAPPGHPEGIDSRRLHLEGEFMERNLGVQMAPDGTVIVRLVAHRYGFAPNQVSVPTDTPIQIRVATTDVIHGMLIPETNVNAMIVPGYVTRVKARFSRAGDYPLLCHEFCGVGHDSMWARIQVVNRADWLKERRG